MYCCSCQEKELQVPDLGFSLHVGDKVKLQRYERKCWIVQFGWFSFSGNKPICGWYLSSLDDSDIVKPLNLSDLDDIYLIEH